MIPPPGSWDPPEGPLYFVKKFPPLPGRTHQLYLRTQGSVSGQKENDSPRDCWDPPATSSHARKCVRAKKTIRPPDCWDPPATSSHARKCVGAKKMIRPPDCWDPPSTSSHARKCDQAKKRIRPPDCWDPPATSLQARKCLTVGTHLVEA